MLHLFLGGVFTRNERKENFDKITSYLMSAKAFHLAKTEKFQLKCAKLGVHCLALISDSALVYLILRNKSQIILV